jgi:nucleotide-binding universal stress UspA family protein
MGEHISEPERIIVVGVDGSPSSVAALRLAASLMPLAGDMIRAVTVWQYPLAFGLHAPIDWNYEELAGKALDQALLEAFPTGHPCAIERQVLHGLPALTLIDESRDASMVVVGSRGHGGFRDLLLGSVSRLVSERAQCPVLVCHGGVHPDELPAVELPAEVSA